MKSRFFATGGVGKGNPFPLMSPASFRGAFMLRRLRRCLSALLLAVLFVQIFGWLF